MLFRNAIFLSVLFTSACAITIHPLLAVRQIGSQCESQCSNVVNQVESGQCSLSCICTSATINAIQSCIQCAQSEGETIPGVGPDYIQTLENDCASSGNPVSGGSTGGSTGGSIGGSSGSSDGLSGTGLGSGASSTGSGSTATGLGAVGGTSTALGGAATSTAGLGSGGSGSSSGGSSGGGISFGKSSATGLTVQLGAVAAAVAGVVILAA